MPERRGGSIAGAPSRKRWRFSWNRGGGRTKAIQLLFSDPSSEPIESALGLKATGAWGGENAGN